MSRNEFSLLLRCSTTVPVPQYGSHWENELPTSLAWHWAGWCNLPTADLVIVGNSYNASCDEKTVPTVAYVTFAAELHIFGISVSTPAYTSLTNCVWEGARSQAEAGWALSTIRGCHVRSHKSNSECSTILDWIQRAVVLHASYMEKVFCFKRVFLVQHWGLVWGGFLRAHRLNHFRLTSCRMENCWYMKSIKKDQ